MIHGRPDSQIQRLQEERSNLEGTRPLPPGGEGAAPGLGLQGPGDTGVPEKASRRRFTADYKRRILREVEACSEPGAIGALLRREGLYSSLLSAWRAEKKKHGRVADKKRGRKAKPVNPLAKRVVELERSNRKLRRQLDQAETVIDFQKKLSEMLGISLKQPEQEQEESD